MVKYSGYLAKPSPSRVGVRKTTLWTFVGSTKRKSEIAKRVETVSSSDVHNDCDRPKIFSPRRPSGLTLGLSFRFHQSSPFVNSARRCSMAFKRSWIVLASLLRSANSFCNFFLCR